MSDRTPAEVADELESGLKHDNGLDVALREFDETGGGGDGALYRELILEAIKALRR